MKSWIAILFSGSLLILGTTQTQAAIPLATPEQDRYAKQAVPPSGKALIYVYRLDDGNPNTAPGLWLNNRYSGHLELRTYGMWAAGPGRLEIRAGRADATPLSFICEAGRIYFVRLAVSEAGGETLRKVSYGTGRKEVGTARLVLDPSFAARAVAKTAPAPAKKVEPMIRVAPAAKPAARKTQVTSEDQAEKDSSVTLLLKLGSYQLASGTQTIISANRDFSAMSVAYGLEGEWRLRSGLAFSLELFGHTQEYTTTASAESGDMAVYNFFINMKEYFRTNEIVQPYIGFGVGTTAARFSAGTGGGITGSAGGFAVQGVAGVAFRWRDVGIYTELKLKRAEIEDKAGQSVDVSGTGLFAGLSVHF